jgi:tetratricopeptide (TPR) repeat protein
MMRSERIRVTARVLIVSVAFALSAMPLVAHPVLTFTVTSHKEPAAGMKAAGQVAQPSDKTFPLIVTLGHQYLITEAEGTRTIYDFERLRVLRVTLASASYTDDSLYSDIGFRALEFQNRIMLGSALQAGNASVNPMELALVEQLFSLSNPKVNTFIEQRHADGVSEFFWTTQKLMAVSNKTQELPPGYQAEYWRFLRYYAGGHPKVYAALKSLNGVPEKISFVLTNMGSETREITLKAIGSTADTPYSLEGLARARPDEEPYSTLGVLGPDAAAKLAERMEATIKARDAAIAQGPVLEAVLSNMAMLIMSGDGASLTAWIAQHRDALQSDGSARSLSANLEPRDQAGAQKALQVLSELSKQSGSAAYMLDVFQGNTLLSLRDGKAGSDHLLAALKLNPYLLGAWKDLGGYYYQSFRTDKAWACWDAARRINPQHSMLLRITEIERQLHATFPEFF